MSGSSWSSSFWSRTCRRTSASSKSSCIHSRSTSLARGNTLKWFVLRFLTLVMAGWFSWCGNISNHCEYNKLPFMISPLPLNTKDDNLAWAGWPLPYTASGELAGIGVFGRDVTCLVGSLLSWLAFAERSLEPCLAKPMLPSCNPWKTGHAFESLFFLITMKLGLKFHFVARACGAPLWGTWPCLRSLFSESGSIPSMWRWLSSAGVWLSVAPWSSS